MDIESSTVLVRMLNKGFLKDDILGKLALALKTILGVYEFDISSIYFQAKHTLFNSWIALSNPEGKDFNEITGYLKIAISITGPGDEQINLNDETGPTNSDD